MVGIIICIVWEPNCCISLKIRLNLILICARKDMLELIFRACLISSSTVIALLPFKTTFTSVLSEDSGAGRGDRHDVGRQSRSTRERWKIAGNISLFHTSALARPLPPPRFWVWSVTWDTTSAVRSRMHTVLVHCVGAHLFSQASTSRPKAPAWVFTNTYL